jgi:hypothetical protein
MTYEGNARLFLDATNEDGVERQTILVKEVIATEGNNNSHLHDSGRSLLIDWNSQVKAVASSRDKKSPIQLPSGSSPFKELRQSFTGTGMPSIALDESVTPPDKL